jgi:predicted kinase
LDKFIRTLVVTIGITGSGKSTWLKDKSPVVETDDLRVELLDDIDDISQEGLIFGTAARRICKLFETHDTVYFGATLVDSRYRIPFLQSIKQMSDYEVAIDAYIFPCKPETARKRVTKDLAGGVKRADSIQFIDEQYEQYKSAMIGIYNMETGFYNKIERVII